MMMMRVLSLQQSFLSYRDSLSGYSSKRAHFQNIEAETEVYNHIHSVIITFQAVPQECSFPLDGNLLASRVSRSRLHLALCRPSWLDQGQYECPRIDANNPMAKAWPTRSCWACRNTDDRVCSENLDSAACAVPPRPLQRAMVDISTGEA